MIIFFLTTANIAYSEQFDHLDKMVIRRTKNTSLVGKKKLRNGTPIYASSSSPKPTLCPPAFKFRASNNADKVNLTPN